MTKKVLRKIAAVIAASVVYTACAVLCLKVSGSPYGIILPAPVFLVVYGIVAKI